MTVSLLTYIAVGLALAPVAGIARRVPTRHWPLLALSWAWWFPFWILGILWRLATRGEP